MAHLVQNTRHTDIQKHIELIPVSTLKPYARNARTHSKKQVRQIANSIKRFGFNNPVLIDENDTIIAGHGRVEAAKLLKLTQVPALRLSHLSPTEQRAYILADNRLAEKAGWDKEILAGEFQGLMLADFDIELTGFEVTEVDLVLEAALEAEGGGKPEDHVPPAETTRVVSRAGDLWLLGQHRLLCGNALRGDDYALLMEGEAAQMVFTDPPFNVPIAGHVGGLGRVRHREFAMASGEMSEAEFTEFLQTSLAHTASVISDGAICFVCMDWRHMRELLAAGHAVFRELKNLIVWAKDNGGMGTFYRSRHELIFVWKHGEAPHINTFELGQHGRSRTNVWEYAGVNTWRSGRQEELAMHPTVKPTLLVADAIKDCSKPKGLILDPFGGSGTTLIAAEKTGRRARLIELDPVYCDVIVRRWETYTGKKARLAATGLSFEDMSLERLADLALA